ncbi:MAG: TSUP family transporter, partial [Acidimicrobiales bacterium]
MSEVVTWTTAATLVLGFGSGVLAGMFGIGGAVLTTPAIRVLGATPIEGVGSTVPSILPGAISGAYRYAKAGLVDWRVGLVCGITGG